MGGVREDVICFEVGRRWSEEHEADFCKRNIEFTERKATVKCSTEVFQAVVTEHPCSKIQSI